MSGSGMNLRAKRLSEAVKILKAAFFLGLTAVFIFQNGFAAPKETYNKKTTPRIFSSPTSHEDTPIQQIGPVEEEPALDGLRLYDVVLPQKPLLSSTQFKLVDDFNSSGPKNRFNAEWVVEVNEKNHVKLERNKEDSRGLHRGGSLLVRFDLRKGESLNLVSPLARLDMSAAHFFALKCKVEPVGKNYFDGRILVSLTDWAGKTVGRDVTRACGENASWNNAILPISVFQGIDLNQLDHLDITVEAPDQRVLGKLGLDEITFFGHAEVGFESTEDNLKGFPKVVFDARRRDELVKTANDTRMLTEIARDTWGYFEKAVNKASDLVVDHFKVGDSPMAAMYTSPTNIAMDLMGSVAAMELGFISREEAAQRVARIFKTLQKLKKWKGFFFNFYETTRLNVTTNFISSVDNSWLAIAFVVARQAFPGEIAREATVFLKEMNFQEFLDPENNHLSLGYDMDRDMPAPYHYGMLVTEARAMSLLGIGKGDLPRQHWWYLFRTAPEAWDWQTQRPQGRMVEREGVSYFQGYYEDGPRKFVPSWGGSLFEFLMPSLVINEKKLAPQGLGLNNRIATEIHRDYALKEKKYPVWGISPASTSSGRQWQYNEYGVKKLGAKGYPDKGVITPYAAFLALESLPRDAVKNIRQMLTYNIYGECGFYDSISFPGERVNPQYLALDQGMILLALANHLKKGVIQGYFQKDPIFQNAKDLLEEEAFFRG